MGHSRYENVPKYPCPHSGTRLPSSENNDTFTLRNLLFTNRGRGRTYHAGATTDPATGSVNLPIYQTSTFRQREVGGEPEWEYSRTGNPTRSALEGLIAELEGGTRGFAFASGMAAITAVLSLFSAGDEIVISHNVYGGTYRLLDRIFSNFGITFRVVGGGRPHASDRSKGLTPTTSLT